ncbi:hypothetical protein MAR_017669, partial [Mya arenaria]
MSHSVLGQEKVKVTPLGAMAVTTTSPPMNPGGEHITVYTARPPPEIDNGTRASGAANTTTIIVGILVPIILIGVGALIFYVWYRRKYPVRMGIGRNFTTFSNPAYSKKESSVTLVRDDPEKLYRTLSRRNPATIEERIDEVDGQVNPAFEPEQSPELATVEMRSNSGIPAVSNISTDTKNKVQPVESDIAPIKAVGRDRPRKRATLIRIDVADKELDNNFDPVTESDLGIRTASDMSIGNDSTDTHTINLSFSGIHDNRPESMERSRSEQFLWTHNDASFSNTTLQQKGRSQSDSFATRIKSNESRKQDRKLTFENACSEPLDENKTDSIDEFEKLEKMIDSSEKFSEKHYIPQLESKETISHNDNDPAEMMGDETNVINVSIQNLKSDENDSSTVEDIDKLDEKNGQSLNPVDLTDDNNDTETTVTDQELETNADSIAEREEDVSLETKLVCRQQSKRPSLTLSKENIVMDQEMPTILVQDEIIFEPETPNPIDLHCSPATSPRRGRRAFTLNDIAVKLPVSNYQDDDRAGDEKSRSTPAIYSGVPTEYFWKQSKEQEIRGDSVVKTYEEKDDMKNSNIDQNSEIQNSQPNANVPDSFPSSVAFELTSPTIDVEDHQHSDDSKDEMSKRKISAFVFDSEADNEESYSSDNESTKSNEDSSHEGSESVEFQKGVLDEKSQDVIDEQ